MVVMPIPPCRGIPLNANSKAKNRKVEKDAGRADAPTPQVPIVLNIRTDGLSEALRTTDDSLSVAPHSEDPEVNMAVRGEIAIGEANQYDIRGNRSSLNGGPVFSVTTNVNGLRKDAPVIFGGCILFAGQGKGKDYTKDNAATLLIFGVINTVNTGPDPIGILQRVFITVEPYTLTDHNGNVIPGVQGAGIPNSKFRPATHAMNNINTLALIQALRQGVQAILHIDQPSSAKAYKQLIVTLQKSLSIHDSMPLAYWLRAHAAKSLHIFAKDTFPEEQRRIYIAEACINCLEFFTRKQQQFGNALGYDFKTKSFKDIFDLTNVNSEATIAHFHRKTQYYLEGLVSMCHSWQHDFLNAFYVGLSLSSAPPGKAFDLFIRAM